MMTRLRRIIIIIIQKGAAAATNQASVIASEWALVIK